MYGYKNFHGGNRNENGNSIKEKLVMRGYKEMHGGDLNENDNFKEGESVLHHYNFLRGAISTKMTFLIRGN